MIVTKTSKITMSIRLWQNSKTEKLKSIKILSKSQIIKWVSEYKFLFVYHTLHVQFKLCI